MFDPAHVCGAPSLLALRQHALLGSALMVVMLMAGTQASIASAPKHAVHVNRTIPKVSPPAPLSFSAEPRDAEFLGTGLFTEPLAPVAETNSQDNRDLAQALIAYRNAVRSSGASDAVEPLLQFIAVHPDSAWNPVLQLNLGIIYRQTGHFSRALTIWDEGWRATQRLSNPAGHAIANSIVARLSQLEAYLGRKELLQPLLDSIDHRPVGGTAAQLLTDSHTGLYDMLNQPEKSFLCGPLALKRILTYTSAQRSVEPARAAMSVLEEAQSTPNGLSLSMVQQVSAKAGMD